MNIFIASFFGFALGVGVSYLGLKFLMAHGLRAVAMGHPAGAEVMAKMAESSCWAHAGMLDENGYTSAAAFMVMAASGASITQDQHLLPAKKIVLALRKKYEPVVNQGNLPFPLPGNTLVCSEHGESLWAGHIQCLRCLRTYEKDSEAPRMCECGYRLLPQLDGQRPLPSSGNRLCRHCVPDSDPEIIDVEPPSEEALQTPVFDYPMVGLWRWGACERCGAEIHLRFGDVREVQAPPPSVCPACLHGAKPERDAIPLPPSSTQPILPPPPATADTLRRKRGH